jgi:hypothetical protein
MASKTCPECGSDDLIESGVFTHGTWIRRLTCLTCSECCAIFAVTDDFADVESGSTST